MTILQAKNKLQSLGFEFPFDDCNFGTTKAENYDFGRDHFEPRNRQVFIGKCRGGWYVTSHIKGMMCRYRCRTIYETNIANIFGGGQTLAIAVKDFSRCFTAKLYNTTR
jgi:hypothetical protein